MEKQNKKIINLIFLFASIIILLQISLVSTEEAINIMALGDSITDGFINSDNGYRKYLQYYLKENNILNFDMVGPNNGWTNEAAYLWNNINIKYDPAHAGFSGFAIQEIPGRRGLKETIFDTKYNNEGKSGNMLEAYKPNIVLLQIGTNDLLDCALEGITDRLEALIDLIIPYLSEERDMLYVASVPDIDAVVRNDWLTNYEWKKGISYKTNPTGFVEEVNKAVDEYNSSIKSLVNAKKGKGVKIEFCDINSVIDRKKDLKDGVHPNEEGYANMGKLWANLLMSTYFK